jgi:sulfur relay (sulfurtransferase) DsrC/TusE family protein
MKEKPNIDVIRRSPRYGPQGFIKDLDKQAKVKIAHNIAFNIYRFENFEHLWSREWVVKEPELELASRWLQKDLHASRSRSRAEAMIRVWWLVHNIEEDEFALLKALDEAWELTQRFRDQHEIRKLEEQAYRTPHFIRDYFSKHETATAAEIARSSGIDRKTINQALRRMCESGNLVKVSRGVYQRRGDKWWL